MPEVPSGATRAEILVLVEAAAGRRAWQHDTAPLLLVPWDPPTLSYGQG